MTTSEANRAHWTAEHKKMFIDMCLEEVRRGKRPGANLKRASWTRIMEGFFRKTGIKYTQKQFKNLWDGLKKSYGVWTKLLREKGIEYDETTHMITMEPERWNEYLKANPDAKPFRTRPLQFADDMKALFGVVTTLRATTRGLDKSTRPTDLLGSSSQTVHDFQASQDFESQTPSSVPTTPLDPMHEVSDDIELEVRPTSLSRKRRRINIPACDSCPKKENWSMEIWGVIDRILSTSEKDSGPTIAECIKSLNEMSEITKENPLYISALNLFRVKENRELWMAVTDESVRVNWIKSLISKDDLH